jgi:phosphatidylglycerophosphatase C
LPALQAEARTYQLQVCSSVELQARVLWEAFLAQKYPHTPVCAMMTWCYAGYTLEEIMAFTQTVLAECQIETRYLPETREIIEWARELGATTLVVSASPKWVVDLAARPLGFGHEQVFGMTPKLNKQQIQLSELVPPLSDGVGKVEVLDVHFAGRPLLAAFGDSPNDLAMLQRASMGIVVRPKPAMNQHLSNFPNLRQLSPCEMLALG